MSMSADLPEPNLPPMPTGDSYPRNTRVLPLGIEALLPLEPKHLLEMGGWPLSDNVPFIHMLARVMDRVPREVRGQTIDYLYFALGGDLSADYFPPAVLCGGTLIVLGDGILGQPENEQVDIILRQVARVVCGARHRLEPALEQDISGMFDPATGKSINFRLWNERARLHADANFEKNVIDGVGKRAEAETLSRRWQQQWAAAQAQRERPAP
jgi:hypothetical protein